LGRIWDAGKSTGAAVAEHSEVSREKRPKPRESAEYSESHHTEGKPREVIELYRGLDRLCQDLAPGRITRAFKAKYVSWSLDKAIFCCAHLQQGGLRVWVKTDPKALDPSESLARDVSKIGHWGVGDVELAIDRLERLRAAQKFVRESFDREIRKHT
jgi:predicted transport protein